MVATKLEAFKGRGNRDFLASRDFGDIIAIVDGREELVDDVAQAPADVRDFIASEFGALEDCPTARASRSQALASAVAALGYRELAERLAATHPSPSTPEQLASVAIAYVQFALERPALFRIMYQPGCSPAGAAGGSGTASLPTSGAAAASWAPARAWRSALRASAKHPQPAARPRAQRRDHQLEAGGTAAEGARAGAAHRARPPAATRRAADQGEDGHHQATTRRRVRLQGHGVARYRRRRAVRLWTPKLRKLVVGARRARSAHPTS